MGDETMARSQPAGLDTSAAARPYRLDDQVGFLLRQVTQRHASIFAAGIEADITPTQWAALCKLAEVGPLTQNRLGRLTVMDAATIKGVIDRLSARALVTTDADPTDGRRRVVSLTESGHALVERLVPAAVRITQHTLAPLSDRERMLLQGLLLKLC